MFFKVLIVLAFVGILSGLARLLKSEEIDLENKNNALIKCPSCGSYFPRSLSKLASKSQICKKCKP
jgi:ribosomal protein L37AE/L43A|tara:strand:- start:70 stop:267 length:198 start_codon:yes stop_codon:yes gene_type:complete